MKVKELIIELMEYEMDSNVEITIEDNDIEDFTLSEYSYSHNSRYLRFEIEVKGMTLVDDDDLEELKEKADSVNDLESRIRELEESLEQQYALNE